MARPSRAKQRLDRRTAPARRAGGLNARIVEVAARRRQAKVQPGPMGRSIAVNAIRGFGTFRNASLRLLSDLVEYDGAAKIEPDGLGLLVKLAKAASFSLYHSLDLK